MDQAFGTMVMHPITFMKGLAQQYHAFEHASDLDRANVFGHLVGGVLLGGLIPGGAAIKDIADVTKYTQVSGRFFVQGAKSLVNPRVENFQKVAEHFLGKDYQMKLNKSGDPVFINKANTKRIRFDVKNPHGDSPHGHVEIKVGKRWRDYTDQHRIYVQETPAPENNPTMNP